MPVFILKLKSEFLDKFKEYQYLAENQLSIKIKVLRTDNGTEYMNNIYFWIFNSSDIQHRTSIPYSPQHNGLSECYLLYIILNSKLYKHLWAVPIIPAVHTYIVNRSQIRALNYKISEEIWSGRKPDLSHMKIFGSCAMAQRPKGKNKKWDS